MIKNMKIDSFWLKIIAAIIMVIDHIGCYFITDMGLYLPMRLIGRLVAPIFLFCFVEGFIHTSSKKKYGLRLGIAATIMSVGNVILGYLTRHTVSLKMLRPNIFATLFAMFLVLVCLEKTAACVGRNKPLHLVLYGLSSVFLCAIVVEFLEYGIIAVFSILCFYLLRNQKKELKFWVFIAGSVALCLCLNNILQSAMCLAAIPLWFYTDEKPKHKMKYFFYVFYIAHIWAFALMQAYIFC